MRITAIRLKNFRNYESLNLLPHEGLNVLVGENAAGKTNALEAVFLSALGKSHRATRDVELIRQEEDFAAVDTDVITRGGSRSIGVRISRHDKKRILIDGTKLARSGELMGVLNVVLFSPEDLSLVKDGPGERRRFLNMALSQQTPRYYYLLQQYNAALKQRNALLRPEEPAPEELMFPFEEQLALSGTEIMRLRRTFVERLNEAASKAHGTITGNKERLSLRYLPSVSGKDEDAGLLLEKLRENRRRDGFRGGTGIGPHRDDLAIELDGAEARIYGSQGQQRTAVLSLKLAELEILTGIRGEKPVLLLDDVFSELDRARQRLLLGACEGAQTFITCTHIDELKNAGVLNMHRFTVEAGTLREET